MSELLLNVKNLSVNVEEKSILHGINLTINKGETHVLMGPNGAGKSTLMKMIAGIEQPSAGKMYMDGQEVYFKDTNAARAKGIGIITRNFLFSRI